jgi:hypothetical protein
MNQIEAQITDAELNIIKSKIRKTNIFLFLFWAFVIFWGWGLCDLDTLFSFFNIIVAVFVILTVIMCIMSYKRLKLTKNDFAERIKIVTEFKVIDKHCTSTKSYRYTLEFDSKDIPKYEVKKSHYDLININDSISIEYSKAAFWILKIEHNGIDIENKQMIQ